jgi:hypothetical protein
MNSSGDRGDGPYTHGSHMADGPGLPGWLRRNWEYCEVRAGQVSSWTVMA